MYINMKTVLIFIFSFVSVFGGFIANSTYEAIPRPDGTFYLMNTEEVEEIIASLSTNFKTLEVDFYLFTRQYPNVGQKIVIGDRSSLQRSNFNPRNPTRIITHGWRNDVNAQVNLLVRDAYFRRGNFNVIVVDWGSAANANYVSAKNEVENVGKILAQFIDFLNTAGGMRFNNLYLIGHSLGAHVSGFAGKFVKRGKINTIIGLDPAWPLFHENNPQGRLDTTDAEYVETIHTNGDKLGFFAPIGHTSFYPNGGKKQPGCGMDLSGTCSHSRSYQLFAESINSHFSATGCNNIDEVKQEKCSRNVRGVTMGGEPSNYRKASGIYYLKTNAESPYAKF